MRSSLQHWPEYAIEGTCLGLFMVSAAAFATLMQHPASPFAGWAEPPLLQRLPMGIAMGLTAAALIYSPLGKRSGAHMNPAVTFAFLRLGKIAPRDAAGYVAAQFAGGFAGIAGATVLLGGLPSDATVNFVATVPGLGGPAAAFAAEAAISFVMMTVVLTLSNAARWSRYTGCAAGALVAAYIVLEAPVSGMSMNPARTLGSNVLAGALESLWIYFTAPLLGMLLAAELFVRRNGYSAIRCAKLHHTFDVRCIFRCGHAAASREIDE
jgi:aquaporin Z